jgi:tRNA(adenine34) deaminase
MRMLTFFINRAGKGLTAERRAELEKAKVLLSQRIHRDRKARRKKAALTQA